MQPYRSAHEELQDLQGQRDNLLRESGESRDRLEANGAAFFATFSRGSSWSATWNYRAQQPYVAMVSVTQFHNDTLAGPLGFAKRPRIESEIFLGLTDVLT